MEATRDKVLRCFARGMTIRQAEVSLSMGHGSIRERYPDVHQLFERRRFLMNLQRDAKIAEEWVSNFYCSYPRLRWLLERKRIMEVSETTIKEATSRYMPYQGDNKVTISIMSKL